MATQDLSYSNVFNQQKIIINDSAVVSVPNTGVLTTVLTVSTGETITPTARVFIEHNGIMAQIYNSTSGTFRTIVQSARFYTFFNANNDLVVQVYSFDTFSPTIYYRVYIDGRVT